MKSNTIPCKTLKDDTMQSDLRRDLYSIYSMEQYLSTVLFIYLTEQ